MKKILACMLSLGMVLSACSCVSGDNTVNQGTGTASSGTNTTLGDYSVIIDSCRLARAYLGDPIVIVKYKFTNNSSEPASFTFSIRDNVFQNGVGLNECYAVADSANYSSDNQFKEIKQGVTLDVEVAYTLNDTITDIEVEVFEWLSFSNTKIQKTFSIR